MTLTSEKDLRMSSRVVVVKESTFWVEFWATLWWTTCGHNIKISPKWNESFNELQQHMSPPLTPHFFFWLIIKSSTWFKFELGWTLNDPGPGTVKVTTNQVRLWCWGELVSLKFTAGALLHLLYVEDCYSPHHNSTTDFQSHQFPSNPKQLILMGTPPPFICWPLLKGHMQLRGGHCLGNKGQLLSHDLTKGTAAVNRFYALLMFSRHLFLLSVFLNTVMP